MAACQSGCFMRLYRECRRKELRGLRERMDTLYKLRCLGYVEIEDSIWFANIYFNALVRLNKVTGQIESMEKFPNYGLYESWLYSTVYYVEGFLVFIPNNSAEIAAYHVETRKFISTVLDHNYVGRKKTYFVNAYVYGHYVYMFPTGSECIVRYDVQNHTVKYLENSLSALIRTMPDTWYCFYQQFDEIDGKIYLPFLELNAAAVFDVRSESVEIRYLDMEGGCSTICHIGDYFYLASWRMPKIYRWNLKTDEIKTYQHFPDGFYGEHTFISSCNTGNSVLFFPEMSNMILSFHIKTEELVMVKRIPETDKELMAAFFAETGYHDKNFLLTRDMNGIGTFEYKNNRLMIEPYCQMCSEYNKKRIKRYMLYDKCMNTVFEEEGELQEYLEIILEKQRYTEESKGYHCGNTIYELVCPHSAY